MNDHAGDVLQRRGRLRQGNDQHQDAVAWRCDGRAMATQPATTRDRSTNPAGRSHRPGTQPCPPRMLLHAQLLPKREPSPPMGPAQLCWSMSILHRVVNRVQCAKGVVRAGQPVLKLALSLSAGGSVKGTVMFTHPQVSSEADCCGSRRWLPRPGTSLGRGGMRLKAVLPAACCAATGCPDELFAAKKKRTGSY